MKRDPVTREALRDDRCGASRQGGGRLSRVPLRCIIVWAIGCLLAAAQPGRAEPAAEFEAANKLFEQGKFTDAAATYERLLTNGPTAALHFNLGNARFKSGQPGRAIFHYHQALRITPRDADIRGNLQFARRSLGATVEESLGRHLLRSLTGDEWTWLAGGALGLWFLLLAVGECLPGKRANFGWLTKTCGAAALLFTTLLAAAHTERQLAAEAVVVVAEAPVRPGPLAESKVAFSLRDGTQVEVLDAKGDWVQVRAGQERVGWLKHDAILRWD